MTNLRKSSHCPFLVWSKGLKTMLNSIAQMQQRMRWWVASFSRRLFQTYMFEAKTPHMQPEGADIIIVCLNELRVWCDMLFFANLPSAQQPPPGSQQDAQQRMTSWQQRCGTLYVEVKAHQALSKTNKSLLWDSLNLWKRIRAGIAS